MTRNSSTVLDLTKLMSDQDWRWQRLITRAFTMKHPAAKSAQHFFDTTWENYFHKYLDTAFKLAPDAPVPPSLLNEVLDYAHHDLYPAAKTAGLPESSFLLPDITLDSEEKIMTTNVSGGHGGGARGGGFRSGGFRAGGFRAPAFRGGGMTFHQGGGGGNHPHHGRGRRFFGGDGYGWGYPYPVYYDRLIVIDDDDDDDEDNVLIGANSFDPWRVMQSSPPAPYPVLAGEPPRARDGLLAEVAPVLAPGTGGFTVSLNLDDKNQLNASICVDGKCYRGTMDLSGVIGDVMAKVAAYHRHLHETSATPAANNGSIPDVGVSGELDADVLEAVDDTVQSAGEYLVGALLDRHVTVACAGWFSDITKKVGHAISKGASAVGRTLKKNSAAIGAVAAGAAATATLAIPGAGPFLAPVAGIAAKALVDKALGGGGSPSVAQAADAALATAQAAAKEDPRVAKALTAATKAVAQTTAAFHVAEAAKAAANGDGEAAKQLIKLGEAAAQGDPAAKVAMDLAKQVTTDGADAKAAVSGLPPWLLWSSLAATTGIGGYAAGYNRAWRTAQRQAAPIAPASAPPSESSVPVAASGELVGAVAQKIGDDQSRARDVAAALRARRGRNLIGVEMTLDGEERARFFTNSAQGDSWFERRSDNPGVRYVALFDANDAAWPGPVADTAPAAAETVGHWFVPMAFGAGMGALGFAGFQEWRKRHRSANAPLTAAVQDVKQATEDLAAAAENAAADAAAVSGDVEVIKNTVVKATGKAFTVPELSEDGVPTGRSVMWHPTVEQIKKFGKRTPSFWTPDEGGLFLYKDPNGQPLNMGPYKGKRYLTYAPTWDVMYVDANGQPTWELAGVPSPATSVFSAVSDAVSGELVGTGGPRVEIIGAELGLTSVRKMASDAAQVFPGDVLGILRRADGTWAMKQFRTADDADDWFGTAISNPRSFTYAAYYDKNDMSFPGPLNEEIGRAQPVAKAKPVAIRRGIATTTGADPAAAAGLKALRRLATAGAANFPGNVVGVLRRSNGAWSMRAFRDADAADDWFGKAIRGAFTYAAYFDKGDPLWPVPLNEQVGRAAPPALAARPIRRQIATAS